MAHVDTPPIVASKPLLRGYIHLAAAIVAPFALVGLLIISDSLRDVIGAAVFGGSLILSYTTSAAYHVIPWNARRRNVARALDHSMIFVLIAGTYTPFALKLLTNAWGISIMAVVWGLAAVGMLLEVLAPGAPRLVRVGIYLAIGWVGIVPIVQFADALTARAFALLIASGVLYSAGGLFYARRWPDLFPSVFGFHEAFHLMTALASGLIFFIVAVYVLPY